MYKVTTLTRVASGRVVKLDRLIQVSSVQFSLCAVNKPSLTCRQPIASIYSPTATFPAAQAPNYVAG